ncbi:hypothetical protein R1sor_004424 [Riccia sorocarpa]|uniref:SKP1 component POZ domain-containing protein n=1 Tax=Riccia sorocarpa TaxID=122646 RepID=A0ABD3HH88_9MARC
MAELQFQNHYNVQPKQQQKVILKSRDNDVLEVDEDVAFESETIQAMCRHLGPKTDPPLRVFMVPLTTELLKSVIDFCSYQVELQADATENPWESRKAKWKAWQEQYEKLDFGSICDLLLAANYMDVPSMARMLSKIAASKMPRGQKVLFDDSKGNETLPKPNDLLPKEACIKGVVKEQVKFPHLPHCILYVTKLILRYGGFRKTCSFGC